MMIILSINAAGNVSSIYFFLKKNRNRHPFKKEKKIAGLGSRV
jgi:hypothetical protein